MSTGIRMEPRFLRYYSRKINDSKDAGQTNTIKFKARKKTRKTFLGLGFRLKHLRWDCFNMPKCSVRKEVGT